HVERDWATCKRVPAQSRRQKETTAPVDSANGEASRHDGDTVSRRPPWLGAVKGGGAEGTRLKWCVMRNAWQSAPPCSSAKRPQALARRPLLERKLYAIEPPPLKELSGLCRKNAGPPSRFASGERPHTAGWHLQGRASHLFYDPGSNRRGIRPRQDHRLPRQLSGTGGHHQEPDADWREGLRESGDHRAGRRRRPEHDDS